MKIQPAHLDMLKMALRDLDTAARRAKYIAGDFTGSENCKDLNMRYRWDLMNRLNYCIVSVLFSHMNDQEIDTALRSLVPVL